MIIELDADGVVRDVTVMVNGAPLGPFIMKLTAMTRAALEAGEDLHGFQQYKPGPVSLTLECNQLAPGKAKPSRAGNVPAGA